jgi:thymidylate synthase ThyX
MTITAKIICDSIGPNNIRITTFVLTYPRFIHSEFLTHRAFSRNASSSRAIPFEKQVKMIEEDMAMPIEFRANQKGMQAGQPVEDQELAKSLWISQGKLAIEGAKQLHELGIHKQYVNRILEPYSHISVVVTATEWTNFFALRHHSMAQPELARLAELMWQEYKNNQPKQLLATQWHLPFISEKDSSFSTEEQIKISVARCARTSYNNHDGTNSTLEQDLKLYDRLVGEIPKHMSPCEHQAQALPIEGIIKWSANFKGWLMYRKIIKNENIEKFVGPLG